MSFDFKYEVGGEVQTPNALKYQNPIVISTHKEMLSIQELHLEHLNLSSAMQFPKAALCPARKEIFDPGIELLIIFFVAICIWSATWF